MKVELRAEPYEAYAEVALREQTLPPGKCGAGVMFTGIMRSENEVGPIINKIYLEHYPGMTERQLEELADRAIKQWSLHDVLLLHRVGVVLPGQTIVLVTAWSVHREAAFRACREMLETLKATAAFWKKEYTTEGERWVKQNTQCHTAENKIKNRGGA